MVKVCDEISRTIGELFVCSNVKDFVRIRTPYFYPDGDFIDLFFKDRAGIMTLSDLGETTRWLRMQSTPKKEQKALQWYG